jgi:hypothetical protein
VPLCPPQILHGLSRDLNPNLRQYILGTEMADKCNIALRDGLLNNLSHIAAKRMLENNDECSQTQKRRSLDAAKCILVGSHSVKS